MAWYPFKALSGLLLVNTRESAAVGNSEMTTAALHTRGTRFGNSTGSYQV